MRAVKIVVILMAVLIFAGMIAVVWALFNLKKPAGNRDIAKVAGELSLGLPAGCKIAGMELDGQRLAVRTEGLPGGPQAAVDCERIYIVDVASGDVISTLAR